ncbi:non-ribosomal peptide synthetase [Tenacibaculum sp. M341]|uniref:non-ribosomal peptide synthetase n=1 Tax=Tenacibaculum sp. M341 TaxID=2530339 RepID=UPI0010481621|nr:non-ribosomal peptide synthetase [Tenacibaculum sp. M341]TCI85711.1 amino acid adenylation domain-containing protein [Tenacibaculum sp. M341]
MYTLIDVLNNSAKENIVITFIEGSNSEATLRGEELRENAYKVLAFLQSKGIKSGQELVFQIEDNQTFVVVFWGCVLGGIIPVPLTLSRTEDHHHKLFNIWKILKSPHLIVSSDYLSRIEKQAVSFNIASLFTDIKKKALFIKDIFSNDGEAIIAEVKEDDIAYIQFSSGSTGIPKGVTLTHKNLLTNIKGILHGIKSPAEGDSFFSWMPLTHDMGLIGFHLTPFFAGWSHYIMTTSLFIRRPLLWLDKISEHKISFSASPNFGYSYLIRRFKKENVKNLDLSSLRIIVNGAEPISANLCDKFYQVFSDYGLKKNVIFPVYGLAEASLAVTFSDPTEYVKPITIDRKYLGMGDKVHITDKKDSLSLVNVGTPIKDCYVRIVDSNKEPVKEGIIGEIQIEGDNVTEAYYGNDIVTKATIDDEGWLSTGDMGFFYEDCLFVSGRLKDVIFINGQNYYAHDLERVLGEIPEIELGKVVTAGHTNYNGQNETFVFIYFKGTPEKFRDVIKGVKKKINFVFGFEPDFIIPVKDIPKTTSGKVQRYKLIQRYNNAEFNTILEKIKEEVDSSAEKRKYIQPDTAIEHRVKEIWNTVLGHDRFGITDKFFEVGGNSLKGAQILNSFQKEFNIDFDYHKLYEKQTIKEIAHEIENGKNVTPYQEIILQKEQQWYPLTSMQERLYYFWQLSPKAVAYNVPLAIRFQGDLDIKQLENVINNIIDRHEVLRTYFRIQNQKPQQGYVKSLKTVLTVVEIDKENLNTELKKRVQAFDLHQAPLFRFELLKESKDEYVLFMDIPHVIIDGISVGILLKEIFNGYKGQATETLEIQYKDYAVWRNNFIETEKGKEQQKYWANRLLGELPKSELLIDFSRPSIFSYEGEKFPFNIEKEVTNKLKTVAEELNVPLHTIMLAAYTIVLSKHVVAEEVLVGIPVSGRGHYQLQELLGMFVNNLTLRNFPKGNITFRDYLQEVKNNTLNDLTNQNYPFSQLIKDLNVKNDPSGSPLFSTMFVYQNMEIPRLETAALKAAPYFFDPGIAKFDITLEIIEKPDQLEYYIEYAKALFNKESIVSFTSHFKKLIEQIVQNPNQLISDMTLVSDDVLQDYYLSTKQPTKYTSLEVHELIALKGREKPDSIAVVMREEVPLTYTDLEKKSNVLSEILKERGVKKNTPVAIIANRHIDFVVSILAVLKAEGCFIPVEASYPEDRIRFIVEDCGTQIILADENLSESKLFSERWTSTRLDTIEMVLLASKANDERSIIACDNSLAYIIYTSGSTGRPKGVKVGHNSLMNYLEWARKAYKVNGESTFPLYTSISFDLTLTSIFLPLISGSILRIYQDIDEELVIESVLLDNQVKVLKGTPSHLKIIKDSPLLKNKIKESRLETLIVGGEALQRQLAKDITDLFEGNIQIFNEYGPTETTIGCVVHEFNSLIDKGNNVPIGRAIANTQVYVLDSYLKPVPLGVSGELYISGEGLSEGYLNRGELTKEKFITNPFISGQLMYRSGDLVKRKLNGNLEYLGRLDDQVKINGYRIELGELENVVSTHMGVKDALAVYGKETPLSVYVTLDNEGDSKNIQEEIKRALRKQLPDYMIPAHIVVLDKIPLTKNGKVAYDQLPTPIQTSNQEFVTPVSEIEEMLVEAWKEVLGNFEIGVTNNFYEEGGDSIKAIQIASILFENNIEVKAKDILTYPTIKELTNYVQIIETNENVEELAEKVLEITPIQHWFFDRELQNRDFYNQSVLLKWEDKIEIEILSETFGKLFEYHDALRLNYNENTKAFYYRKQHENLPVEFKRIKLEGTFKDLLKGDLQEVLISIKNSINIVTTSLLKATIITVEAVDYLFITGHHLIIDGVSWRILLKDLYTAYTTIKKGEEVRFPKKTASLIAYKNELKDISKQLTSVDASFWETIKHNEFTIYPNKTIESKVKNQKVITTELSVDDTSFLLKEANTVFNTNAEILLIVALTKTIAEEYKTNQVTLELEGHGRDLENINSSRTIGWFTSLYPLGFKNASSMEESIRETKDLIKSLPAGGIQYGILKYLNKKLNSYLPENNIRFNYLGQFSKETSNNLFSLVNEPLGIESDPENPTGVMLEFNLMVLNDTLKIQTHYLHSVENYYLTQKVVVSFKENILKVLNYLRDQDDIHFTPSDFEAAHLDNDDLKILFE